MIELKNLKYELGTIKEDEEEEEEQAIQESEQEEAVEEGIEGFLQQVLEAGIITQKSSHYYYDGFPKGRIQGRGIVLDAIAETELYEQLQEMLEKSQGV